MDLKRILYLWARNNEERISQLETWLDVAVSKCAANLGQNLASTSANGVSVSFMSDSLTIAQWLSALSEALELIANPTLGSRKAIQVFR